MFIEFSCSACGRKMQAPETTAGKVGKCKCGARVQVPKPSTASPSLGKRPVLSEEEKQRIDAEAKRQVNSRETPPYDVAAIVFPPSAASPATRASWSQTRVQIGIVGSIALAIMIVIVVGARKEKNREAVEAQKAADASEAEARREAEAEARREAEAEARREAEAEARREAEAKAQREAEAEARREAEAKAQREAEAKAQGEAEQERKREAEAQKWVQVSWVHRLDDYTVRPRLVEFVFVEVSNHGYDQVRVNPSYFALEAKGVLYEPQFYEFVDPSKSALPTVTLRDGAKIGGWLFFETPDSIDWGHYAVEKVSIVFSPASASPVNVKCERVLK